MAPLEERRWKHLPSGPGASSAAARPPAAAIRQRGSACSRRLGWGRPTGWGSPGPTSWRPAESLWQAAASPATRRAAARLGTACGRARPAASGAAPDTRRRDPAAAQERRRVQQLSTRGSSWPAGIPRGGSRWAAGERRPGRPATGRRHHWDAPPRLRRRPRWGRRRPQGSRRRSRRSRPRVPAGSRRRGRPRESFRSWGPCPASAGSRTARDRQARTLRTARRRTPTPPSRPSSTPSSQD
mmetsp:Transcript_57460/g.168727  ORF Transcript_57460/g.168727 Transcript_57460/m.168727 type:complete len:241 (+) Transcript_57460:549-1271(+)